MTTIQELITQFNQSGCEANLSQLCKTIKKDEEKAEVLLKIFGQLARSKVSDALVKPLKDVYQIKYENLLSDLELLITHNIANLWNEKPLKIVPNNLQYSWKNQTHFLLSKSDDEISKKCLSLFIFSSGMPLELSIALNFRHITYLATALKKYNEDYNKMISLLFGTLKNASEMNQPLLISSAAIGTTTWGEEFSQWVKETRAPEGEDFLKQLKICQIFQYKFAPHVEAKSSFKFDTSFRHYVIKKTLHQFAHLISTACYDELATLFVQSESERRVANFAFYMLRGLFSSEREPYVKLYLLAIGDQNNFEMTLKLIEKLTENPITLKFLKGIASIFYIEFQSQLRFDKQELFTWFYQSHAHQTACDYYLTFIKDILQISNDDKKKLLTLLSQQSDENIRILRHYKSSASAHCEQLLRAWIHEDSCSLALEYLSIIKKNPHIQEECLANKIDKVKFPRTHLALSLM